MPHRSPRWEHPTHSPAPQHGQSSPGTGGCSRPQLHLLPEQSQALTRAVAPRYVPGLGMHCTWLRLAPHQGGDGGSPNEFLSLGSSTCPGARGSSCSRDIPAGPPQPRVNANRSWVKPEMGLPGVKICTIYSCANASKKRGLSLFNQFSGRRLPHPLVRISWFAASPAGLQRSAVPERGAAAASGPAGWGRPCFPWPWQRLAPDEPLHRDPPAEPGDSIGNTLGFPPGSQREQPGLIPQTAPAPHHQERHPNLKQRDGEGEHQGALRKVLENRQIWQKHSLPILPSTFTSTRYKHSHL